MDTSPGHGTSTPCFDELIDALRKKDARKNAFATAMLCRLGEIGVVELLVQEANKPRRQPDHRVRILDVIQQIGTPLGPQEYFGITSLLAHRSVKVRVKAAEVLDALSPSGTPCLSSSVAMLVGMEHHPALCYLRAFELGRRARRSRRQRRGY